MYSTTSRKINDIFYAHSSSLNSDSVPAVLTGSSTDFLHFFEHAACLGFAAVAGTVVFAFL